MMQLARRVSLVVALLLASVGTASAECAWVLWQREISEKPDGVWVPRERLFKDVAECKALASKADHRYNPQTKTMEPIPGGHTICLPDTIDPRGPKGR
jgi:hypothetical protein